MHYSYHCGSRCSNNFATEASQFGKGTIYIASTTELEGVSTTSGNCFEGLEKETALAITPKEFIERAGFSLSAEESRKILKDMVISIPARIAKSDMSRLLKDTPKLTPEQTIEYLDRAGALH